MFLGLEADDRRKRRKASGGGFGGRGECAVGDMVAVGGERGEIGAVEFLFRGLGGERPPGAGLLLSTESRGHWRANEGGNRQKRERGSL